MWTMTGEDNERKKNNNDTSKIIVENYLKTLVW